MKLQMNTYLSRPSLFIVPGIRRSPIPLSKPQRQSFPVLAKLTICLFLISANNKSSLVSSCDVCLWSNSDRVAARVWGRGNASSVFSDALLGLRVSLIIVIQSNLVAHISEFSPRTWMARRGWSEDMGKAFVGYLYLFCINLIVRLG